MMNEARRRDKGTLEVVCGSMFSGKTEELIRRMKRAAIANKKTLAFKPSIDTRKTTEYVLSHSGAQVKAFAVDAPQEILALVPDDVTVVGIDEVQFFNLEIIPVIARLIERQKRVIVSGLDLDHSGRPFGAVPILMAIADKVDKLNAICMTCGDNAHYTQRLVNGNPACADDPLIQVGGEEAYQARCRSCFSIDRYPF